FSARLTLPPTLPTGVTASFDKPTLDFAAEDDAMMAKLTFVASEQAPTTPTPTPIRVTATNTAVSTDTAFATISLVVHGVCDGQQSGTACVDDHNPCTLDVCNGSGQCTHLAGNAGTVCRPAAGACDVAETCTGTSTTCPADAKSTAVCRPATGDCDAAETCDGVSNDCPADALQPANHVCRAAAGQC